MKRCYIVLGLYRGGTHAIATWIAGQTPVTPVYMVNDSSSFSKPLAQFATHVGRKGILPPFYAPLPLQMDEARKELLAADAQTMIQVYGDVPLDQVTSDSIQSNLAHAGGMGWHREILLLRDAPNLFASRLSLQQVAKKTTQDTVKLWKEYAKEALHPTYGKVVINFNHWCQSKTYRRDLARDLQFIFTDRGRMRVTGVGLGSSFDKRQFDGNAVHMKLSSRWKHCIDDPRYRELLADKEVRELTAELFGFDKQVMAALKGLKK